MVIGPPQWKIELLKEEENNPSTMEETKLEASKSEKYPEDWINEKGTSASITKTMNKSEAELKSTIDNIIDIAKTYN